MDEMKKPAVRFAGFTGAWEQRKWVDTVDISKEMVDPKSGVFDELPHIAPGNIESFTGALYDNINLVKDEQLISGKFHFYPGDIIYGKINPQLGKYHFSMVEGLTSADAYVLNAKNGVSQKFLFTILQTRDFYSYSVSVSKRSGMPKINRDELNTYSFFAPDMPEQELIGSLFLSLDHLITLHQRKGDKLKNIKKSMLEKMFPKNGSDIPEVRFAGFTGAWEQRKLGDVYMERNERGNEALPILSVSIHHGISNGELDRDSLGKQVRRSEDKSLYKHVKSGDLVLNMMRAWQGAVGVARIEGMVSPAYITAEPCDQLYPSFMDYCLRRKAIINQMDNLSYGVTDFRKRLYWDSFIRVECSIPSIHEQMQISSFFATLDHLITLHQRELEKLKNIKKSMLEKMFV